MNMTGVVSFYLASPFSFLIAFFDKQSVTEGILLITILKTAACGKAQVRRRAKMKRFSSVNRKCQSGHETHRSNRNKNPHTADSSNINGQQQNTRHDRCQEIGAHVTLFIHYSRSSLTIQETRLQLLSRKRVDFLFLNHTNLPFQTTL